MDKIKEFVKKYKKHIGGAVIVLLILVWAFWYGGNAPGVRGFKLEKTEEGVTTEAVGLMEERFSTAMSADVPRKSLTVFLGMTGKRNQTVL